MGLLHLDFNFGGGPTEIPDLFPFIAGYVGAFIVLAAGSLSYCLEQWDILTAGMIFISSFVGGFLGVLELKFIACSSHDIYLSFAPLAFIWPTGVALLLGLLLHWE